MTYKVETNLNPCPFCASTNLRVSQLPLISKNLQDFTIQDCTVQCNECGAEGPKIAFVENVIKAWNERK